MTHSLLVPGFYNTLAPSRPLLEVDKWGRRDVTALLILWVRTNSLADSLPSRLSAHTHAEPFLNYTAAAERRLELLWLGSSFAYRHHLDSTLKSVLHFLSCHRWSCLAAPHVSLNFKIFVSRCLLSLGPCCEVKVKICPPYLAHHPLRKQWAAVALGASPGNHWVTQPSNLNPE